MIFVIILYKKYIKRKYLIEITECAQTWFLKYGI